MESENRKKILIADDSDALIKVLPLVSKKLPYDYISASTVTEAIAKINNQRPDLVISDFNLPMDKNTKDEKGGEGMGIVEAAKKSGIPVILTSATETVAKEAQEAGVPFVAKRGGTGKLLEKVGSVLFPESERQTSLSR